jgi:hypothetical protein
LFPFSHVAFLSQADFRKTHPFRLRGKPAAQLVSKGVLLGLAPLALALAVAPEARAMAPVPVIDNIGSAAFPDATNDRGINNANWLVHSFKTPVASSAYLLKSLRLALANTDGAPVRPLVISLYNSSDSGSAINGSPTVNITGGFRPVNQPLATTSVSPLLNTSGNFGATGVNGYTVLDDLAELGSLFDYQLLTNTHYSRVFSVGNASTIQ